MGTSVRESFLPSGDVGSLMTVARMRDIVHDAIRNPLVVETAHSIAMRFPPRAHVRIALGIRDWMAERFLFVRDPIGVELVRTPEYLLRQYEIRNRITGDCDDATVLCSALAMSVGIPSKFVTLGFDHGGKPGMLSHIFALLIPAQNGKNVPIPCDITKPPGTTASVRRRLEFSV